jgi:hypothetical protein
MKQMVDKSTRQVACRILLLMILILLLISV